MARKNFPAKDLKEFVAYVRENGPKLNMAHAGVGSVSHTTGVLLTSVLGIKPNLVPYRGTGPALNDLMANTVDFMTDQIVNVATQISGDTIRGYGVATPERSPALPDLPTTKQGGLDGYEVSAWNAVFAPKALPKDVAAKLVDALDKALDDANTRKRILDLGGIIPSKTERTPEVLQTLVQNEVARWTPILKAAGAVAN